MKKFLCTFIILTLTSPALSTFAETPVEKNNLPLTVEQTSISPRERGDFVVTNPLGAGVRLSPVPSHSPVAWYPLGTRLRRYYKDPIYQNGIAWYYVRNESTGQLGYIFASDGVPD